MRKKFLRTLFFIVGMTLTLGASPTIAMDDEETPLTNHSRKAGRGGPFPARTSPLIPPKPKDLTKEDKTQSTLLKKSIKHVEPGCFQSVYTISVNYRWDTYTLDEPYYDISDYTGGCHHHDDDLMCFDTLHDFENSRDKDTDGEGKVMTRRDALRVMDVVNREKLEYYSNNPEKRGNTVKTWESSTLKFTYDCDYYGGPYSPHNPAGPYSHQYRYVQEGVSYITLRSKEIIEYERKLKAKGMRFVAYDLN